MFLALHPIQMTNILSLYKVNYIEESDYILQGFLSLKKSYLNIVKIRPSHMKGIEYYNEDIVENFRNSPWKTSIVLGHLWYSLYIFGSLQKSSAVFCNLPKSSEQIGNRRKVAENFLIY